MNSLLERLNQRLKAILPKPAVRKAEVEESTIRMRRSRNEVQNAVDRLTVALQDKKR